MSVLALALGGAATSAVRSPLEAAQPGPRVQASAVREHLAALQRIADRNGGNRATGNAGYDASARYVATRMRRAGYAVRLQEFTFPYVVDRSPPLLRTTGPADWNFRASRDYATLAYSGAGRVEARVVAVDLLVLIALIVGGIGVRRLRGGKGEGLLKAAMVIAWIVLAAALVAVWAMSGKPD